MDPQPHFDDLGTLLSETTFVVVDLETTGSSRTDCITEIGAVKVRGGEVLGEFQTLVNPVTAITPFISALTGITPQMVADAPRIAAVLPSFLEFARDSVLVAHNARFDIGFLKRECAALDHEWPSNPVLDTVALARHVLIRGEVPNLKLATLAAHFHAETPPTHRALDDARATVDVLHHLIERVGNRGALTVEDLMGFLHKVSPARRAKRSLAAGLPEAPGVYSFVNRELSEDRHVLYVGKSRNLRRRVATYFTASEKRPRMEEMIQLSTGVEHVVTVTNLEADVTELRLIAAHSPQYNRRSTFPQRAQWLKLTVEPFPRFSLVREVSSDGATYIGPLLSKVAAEDVRLSLAEAFPLRQCTMRISERTTSGVCALAELGRCVAPCDHRISRADYAQIVEAVQHCLNTNIRPVLTASQHRLAVLIDQQRYEEAGAICSRLEGFSRTLLRHHRIASLARLPHMVAARRIDAPNGPGWEIHVVRYGRLVGAGVARNGDNPRDVADALVAGAAWVEPGPGPTPAALVEETEQIAAWLELPGTRLIDIDGEWAWPTGIGIAQGALPELLLGQRACKEKLVLRTISA